MTEEDTFDKAIDGVKHAFTTAMKYVDESKTGPDLYNALYFIHNASILELQSYKQELTKK